MNKAKHSIVTRLLGRETSSGRLIPGIDGLRAVAMIWVLAFHLDIYLRAKLGALADAGIWTSLMAHISHLGHRGVGIFFAISGFILTLPYAQVRVGGPSPPPAGEFWRRRVLRLGPPYFINLTILIAILCTIKPATWPLLRNYAASLGYISYFVDGHPSIINGVAWSLEVEFQFYLIAPTLAAFYLIRQAGLRLFTLLFLTALGLYLRTLAGFTDKTLLGNIHFFSVGIIIADLHCVVAAETHKYRWVADFCGLLGIGVLLTVIPNTVLEHTSHIVGTALLITASLGRGLVASAVGHPILATLGGMSYTFYLYHYTIISAVGRWLVPRLSNINPLVAHAFCASSMIILVVIACVILFYVTEKPFMKRNWWRRSPP